MAATVHKLETSTSTLGVGESRPFEHKDVPDGTAYSVDVHPFYPANEYEGYTHTTQAEVTSFSRRTRLTRKPTMRGGEDEVIYNDILGTVKNVGEQPLYYDLYLIVFD